MGLTLLTAVEIATNYPEQIKIEVTKSGDKYEGFLYKLKGKQIHKLLLSTNPCFDSEEAGKQYFKGICEECVQKYG